MQKTVFNKRTPITFRQFGRKGYSLFACLGREVLIGTLSVATLTFAKAEGISVTPMKPDTTKTNREVRLDEVQVTGTRAPLTRSQQARMVTVLERGDIQAAPAQSVNDLLKYAIGVDVRQRASIGAQTDVSVRGGTSEQITILLNGINICDPQTGHNSFDLPIDMSEIERIEILEGPAGRVYGTSSLVGAINIVTRPKDKTSADFHAEGGSFGYFNAGFRANIANGSNSSNQLSGSYHRSDGFTRSSSGNQNNDLQGYKTFYQGQYADSHMSLYWHAGMSAKGWGSSTSYATPKWKADNQYEQTHKLMAGVQADIQCKVFHFRPSIYWNQHRDRYEGYRNQPEVMKYNYNRTNVFGLNLNSYFDWKAGRTTFGAELRNEDIISSNLGEPLHTPVHIHGTDRNYTLGLNRTNISLHVEHNLLLQRFTLSAGFLAIKNTWNEMPFKVYPGMDASYRIGNNLKLYASWNTSLRMPSFTELYYSVGGHKADKYLQPEEMSAVEAGLRYQSAAINAQLSGFHHHGSNMIDWIMDTSKGDDAVWESVNHTRLNALGVETSLRVNLNQLIPTQQVIETLHMNYCYIHQQKVAEQHIQSQYALEYLRHQLTADVQFRLCRQLTLGLYYRFQERMGEYTSLQGDVLPYHPFALWDARLTWNAHPYTAYLQANNLFDKEYRDYGNVPQPGRWLMAGVRIRL